MKTITDREADEWIANMTPEQIRDYLKEHHALKQALCYQTLHVATGADDWIDRAIASARRAKRAEQVLRGLIQKVEAECAEARHEAGDSTCSNCMGTGEVGDGSCCICRGTGLRRLA